MNESKSNMEPNASENPDMMLMESEESFRLAAATGGFISWESNIITGAIKVSGDARDIVGFEIPQDEAQRLMHVHPDDAEMVEKAMQHTFTTREPLLLEHRLIGTNKGEPIWVRVSAKFVDDHRLIGITQNIDVQKKAEITLRKSEERQAFLLKLSDTLHLLSDPETIQATAMMLTMGHFASDRCYYCEVENGNAIIRQDAAVAGLPSVTGVYDLKSMPVFDVVVNAGRPFVVHDVHTTDLVDESLRQLCIQLQVISFIDIPVIKNNQCVGILCVVQSTPRKWTGFEIELARDVADRIWNSVERGKTAVALLESETRYRNETAQLKATLQSISDAVYIGDFSGITLANQPALDQLGYSSYEELNKNIGILSEEIQTRNAETGEIILPRDQAFAQALLGKHVTKNVRVLHRKSGKERILRSSAAPVIVDGKVVAAVAVNTDITEQWESAAALRQSEQKLRDFNNKLELEVARRTAELQENHRLLESIYNTSHVGMSVFKPIYDMRNKITDFEVVIVNKRIEDSSGRKDLVGKLYTKEFPGIKKMGLFDVMVKAMETGKPKQMEYFYEYEGIKRWYSTMFIRNGNILVSSNLDMTEQKLVEERNKELDRRQKELEEWQQQQIFRTILDTQEEERRRIAENLHNSLGQILYGAKLSLGQITKPELDETGKQNLKNADKLLNDAIAESRRLSHELMPVILEDFGLKTAVEDICLQMSGSVIFKYKFSGLNKRLDKYIEISIYRIVQELMMNVVKHSGASEALVILELKRTHILVMVQDNGKGFDNKVKKANGIGLKTIQNKVSLLNGNINIKSTHGKGVVINIDIPIKN